jgi:hypothetical protein
VTVRRLYLLTGFFGLAGFVALWPTQGFRFALAFLLGAAASLGNLYLFHYLTRAISPSAGDRKKPWEARAFISRYLLLFATGYVIVKALSVNPLAVVLGLLTSTVAVLAASIFELVQSLFARSTSH